MFSLLGSIAKTVVTSYSKSSSQTSSKSATGSSGGAVTSQSPRTKVSSQKTSSTVIATAAKKAAAGVVVSISEQAKAAAARVNVTSGTVSSTVNKGQFMQADKGRFYSQKVTDGYSPSLPRSTPTNPPRTSNLPDSEPIYTRQNSSHEASGNKVTGQVVHTNGTNMEVISDRDPYNKLVHAALDDYKYKNTAVQKALASGDRQALNEAVVAMKEAYAEAEKSGNHSARDAAAKMADELRWKGATIGSESTLSQAKTQVVDDAYRNMKSSNTAISAAIQKGTVSSLDEGVLEAKKLYDRAEKAGDRVGMEAAHLLADDLRAKGGTTYQEFMTLQQASLIDYLRKQNPTYSFADQVKKIASYVADGAPVISTIKGGIEGATGTNPITGEILSPLERGLAWLSFIPGSKLVTGAGKRAGDVVDSLQGTFDVISFEKKISTMNVNERVALIRTTAMETAQQNNWKKDSRLSKQNGRDVYVDPKTGNYYALDTQHGRFEVVNKKGKHQGEVDFNLNPTKPADRSGGHDLKVK